MQISTAEVCFFLSENMKENVNIQDPRLKGCKLQKELPEIIFRVWISKLIDHLGLFRMEVGFSWTGMDAGAT